MPTHVIEKQVGEFTVVGYSLAGEETTVALPEWNVCFDVGRAPREIIPIDNLCISHGHMDHAAGVAYYLSQRTFLGTCPGRVLAHRNLIPPLERLMDCWAEIEGHPSPADFVGLTDGEEVPLRRDVALRAFNVNHGAHALGYTVIERRRKLKPELASHSGPQLVALKKQGIAIENEVEVPMIAYCGDTADGPFADLDHVRNARLLIIECTFFMPEHVTRARAGRHIHARDLVRLLPRLRNQHILLTHVTRRTDFRTAKRLLESMIEPDDRERLTFLMERPRRSSSMRTKQPAE